VDTSDRVLRRRQIAECPPGMILICESQKPAPDARDEESRQYERCYCRNIT
jgi:hypothetical protein